MAWRYLDFKTCSHVQLIPVVVSSADEAFGGAAQILQVTLLILNLKKWKTQSYALVYKLEDSLAFSALKANRSLAAWR